MSGVGASWLFVPGSHPTRFGKAASAGASEVIMDLEDAVAPAAKASARDDVSSWLSAGGTAWVRVNAAGTAWHEDDLDAVVGCRGLRGVVVPKADEPDELRRIAGRLPPGAGVVALVETALGIREAAAVAATPGVTRLAFGSIDFALDIAADETDYALLFARSALVVAARAASLSAPVDGVTVETRDVQAVRAAALRSRSLGFGGKLCIHPAQVGVVEEAFAPAPDELEWARRILRAVTSAGQGTGVGTVDGAMVDKPVLDRARRILTVAGE